MNRDKGAVLSESEQEQARRVETMARVVSEARSVLKPLVTTSSSDHEKRVRKMPESSFANTFDELHGLLTKAGFAPAIAAVLGQIGLEERAAADVRVDWEVGVEQVLRNLDYLDKTQLPEIKTLGKKLENCRLDLETARSSYNNAREKFLSLQQQATELGEPSEPSSSAATAAAPGSKPSPLQQAREQMEAARAKADDQEQRLQEIKDNYLKKMADLLNAEAENARIFRSFLDFKRSYHQRCLQSLDDALANCQLPMANLMQTASKGPVFGVDLETHLNKQDSGCALAVVLEKCLGELVECKGYLEEGLFRMAGSEARIKRLRKEFDERVGLVDLNSHQPGGDDDAGEAGGATASARVCREPHVLAGVVKRYLRELPEPLLCTTKHGNTWLSVAQSIGKKSPDMVQQLREAVAQLPPVYLCNLAYLLDFCVLVASHVDQNKMSPANLAICVGPNLVPQRPPPPNPAPPIDWTFIVNPIAEQLIVQFDQVFPSEYRWFRKQKTEAQNRASLQSENPAASAPADILSVPMRAAKRAPMTSPPPPPPASQGAQGPQGPQATAAPQKAPSAAPPPEAANEQNKGRPAPINPFEEDEDDVLGAQPPHAHSELSASSDALSEGGGGSASDSIKERVSGRLLPASESASPSQQAKRTGSLREVNSHGSGSATPPESLERDGDSQAKANPFAPPVRPPPPRNSAGPVASSSLNMSSPELRRPDAQAYATNLQQAAALPGERNSSSSIGEPH